MDGWAGRSECSACMGGGVEISSMLPCLGSGAAVLSSCVQQQDSPSRAAAVLRGRVMSTLHADGQRRRMYFAMHKLAPFLPHQAQHYDACLLGALSQASVTCAQKSNSLGTERDKESQVQRQGKTTCMEQNP
jgi:hypothetical protein